MGAMAAPAIPTLDAPALVRYGLPELVYATSPATDTDFSATVEGAHFVRLLSVYVTLTTDANAADRYLSVVYTDAADAAYAVSGPPVAVTANSAQPFHFSPFHPEALWPVGGTVLSPLVPILLEPTHKWKIVMTSDQAGDTLTTIRYVQERFYTTHTPSVEIPYP